MPLTQKQMQTRYDYAKKNLKRIPLDVQKEKYEDIKTAADAVGESVNGYIKKAIDERMERDGFATNKNTNSTKAPTLREMAQANEPVKTLREQSQPVPTLKELAKQSTNGTDLPAYLTPDLLARIDAKRFLADTAYQIEIGAIIGMEHLSDLADYLKL